ncbi:hypothetical protein VTN49DRAFT_6015 [Thermomyces lanuginosus]|uniref:uncharacterized protein n=1 Tax=Thermomyces lanuginosus TaxID=5541 RepID=UPI0037420DBB
MENPFTIYPPKFLPEVPPSMAPCVLHGRSFRTGPVHIYPGIINIPMPGVRCPTCEEQGIETWVIQGQNCHVCGTACN